MKTKEIINKIKNSKSYKDLNYQAIPEVPLWVWMIASINVAIMMIYIIGTF